MKNIILIIIISTLVIGSLEAQEKHIHLEAFYTNGEMRLRWAIDDKDLWNWGNEVGYTISRMTTEENGVLLSMEDRYNSKVDLQTSLKPMSASEMESTYADKPLVQTSKDLLYTDSLANPQIDPAKVTLATAISAEGDKNSQFVLTQMTADMDWDAALALGLGYVDVTAVAGYEYIYRITFSEQPASNVELLEDNDLESGLGSWIDGGSLCALITHATFATSGTKSIRLRRSGATANTTIENLDFSNYYFVDFSFAYYTWGMENGDAFSIQSSVDNGPFQNIYQFEIGKNLENKSRGNETVRIARAGLEKNVSIRIQMESNANNDYIFLDDLKIDGIKKNLISAKVVDTYHPFLMTPLEFTKGNGGDLEVSLQWDAAGDAGIYAYYDIERTPVGSNAWTKVNDLPFIYANAADVESTLVNYKDMIPDNDTWYAYRVCGKTPYGVISPPSDTIHVKGRHPQMDISFKVDSTAHDPVADNVIVYWTPQPLEVEEKLLGYDVYRSTHFDGPFQKINTNLLNNDTYAYLDNDPLSSGYYKVTSADVNDHDYATLVEFSQLPDSIPPAIPVIVTAEFTSDTEINVEWNHVVDTDLNGYRLSYANGLNGNYIQHNNDLIKNNSYRFTINQETEIDSIYIKLSSEDNRQNISMKSPAAGVARPDVHAPDAPLISKVAPTPEGVTISWIWSQADDVVKHVLERRATSSPTWMELVTILPQEQDDYPTGNLEVSFIDSSYTNLEEYQYRFTAYDDNYNLKCSKVLYTTPYTDQVKGSVSEVEVEQETRQNLVHPRVQAAYNRLNANTKKVRATPTTFTHDLTVKWTYPLDPNVKEFKVYRSLTGGTMKIYKTIPVGTAMGFSDATVEVSGKQGNTQFSFVDEDLSKNKRYVYEIKAVHKDGSVSNRSSQVSKLVQ